MQRNLFLIQWFNIHFALINKTHLRSTIFFPNGEVASEAIKHLREWEYIQLDILEHHNDLLDFSLTNGKENYNIRTSYRKDYINPLLNKVNQGDTFWLIIGVIDEESGNALYPDSIDEFQVPVKYSYTRNQDRTSL